MAGLTLAVVGLHSMVLGTWLTASASHTRPGGAVSVRAVSMAIRQATTAPAATVVQPSRSPHATPGSTPRPAPPAPSAPPEASASPFLAADRLDRRPIPVSAPDARWLDELASQPVSGLPLRLRLFITAAGEVVGIEPVEVSELDAFALPALAAMFRATAFLPGRQQGRDVASQIELELHLDGLPP